MSLEERFKRWNDRLMLKSAIGICRRVIWLSTKVHYVELIRMAGEAEKVIPKLEKELEELDGKTRYYPNG